MSFNNFCTNLWRRKTISTSTLQDTKLSRCLGLIDLIGLGLGSSLGLGVYVVTSYAITNEAGPSYVISVILAGVASLFAGLCYAEFAARLPRSGSAYLYSYVTLGEFCGFVVGWNLILEYLLSATLAAKAWSQYFDFMLNGTIERSLKEHMEWQGGYLTDDYPDVLAFSVIVIVTLVIASGARVSSTLNLIIVFFNFLIIMCFVCVGYFHVKHENWTNPPGFFAHGFTGVLRGAGSLMFAYANFEVITSSSEETKEPSKHLPSAIMYSVFISFGTYFCVSTATTLSLHDFNSSSAVSLPTVLQTLNVHGASSIISIGGVLGLTASALGACYYLPRVIYSMSIDRILFKDLSVISDKTKMPIYSVLLSGSISAVLALVTNFDMLLQIMSIGTLLAYTIVAISVLCLRYQSEVIGLVNEYEDPDDLTFVECTDFTYANFHLDDSKNKAPYVHSILSNSRNHSSKLYHEKPSESNGFYNQFLSQTRRNVSFDENTRLEINMQDSTSSTIPKDSTYKRLDSVVSSTSNGSVSGLFRIPSDVILEPNESTWRTFACGLVTYIVCSVIMSVYTVHIESVLNINNVGSFVIILLLALIMVVSSVLIAKQPQNSARLFFQTPYVPFVPLLCIVLNVFLLASLSQDCWIRFLVWMAIGLVFYFAYSYRHSLERQFDEQEVILYEITDESALH